MKPIVFTKHAMIQISNRNTSEDEVRKAIRKASWLPAEKNRLTCAYTFPFNKEHYGRFYRSKDVVPIFVDEPEEIVIITVYTFFSQKEV